MSLSEFIEQRPTPDDEGTPMTYEPVIADLRHSFDAETGKHSLSVIGAGISNADDFKSIAVSFYTDKGDRLSLTGGNLERDYRGHSWKGEIKENGADGFNIDFELSKDFILPNYTFTSYHVSAENGNGEWNHGAGTKNFSNPLNLSFGGQREGDTLGTALESFQINFNETINNETEVIYSGKLDSGTTNLNHLMVRATVQVISENSTENYSLDQVIMRDDVNNDGTFSVKRDQNLWDLPEGATVQQSVTLVTSDGIARGYTTDKNTGRLTEVSEGFSNGYSSWQFMQDDWEYASNVLDVNSVYGVPGNSIDVDINHINPEIETQLTYKYDIQGQWEDGLDWLKISPDGKMYGVIPDGFENGGGNIVASHSNPSMGDLHQWFRVSLPLSKRMMGKRYQLVIRI